MGEDLSTQPPTKRMRCDFSKTFDVLVGPEKKVFTLVHDVFVARSGFFEAARSSRWLDDTKMQTDLSDYDPEDFSNYLQLVYTSTIIQPSAKIVQWCKEHNPDEKPDDAKEQINSHYQSLIHMYVVADKLQDLRSCNSIIDCIIEFSDQASEVPNTTTIKHIFRGTPPGSPLRTVIRDMIIYEVNVEYFNTETRNDFPAELLFDIAKEHLNIKRAHIERNELFANIYEKDISEFSKCHYHQHNDRHPKCEEEVDSK